MATKRAAGSCGVCASGPAKYKCPKCPLRYCCVGCSKAHKPRCAGAVSECKTVPEQSGVPVAPPAHLYEQLSDAMLRRLGSSSYVKLATQNPELQAIIKRIDGARDREGALERALATNGDFSEFIDKILETVDPGGCGS